MSDELTPEEKAAFESLPRERMPAGLEAKVVDAMRDHGFLAQRHRVIELSRGRVAGVLAASVALVIVGYSLGLHEGRGIESMLPTETLTTPEPERKYTKLAPPPSTSEKDKDRQAEAPVVANESQELKKEQAREAPPVPAAEPVDQVMGSLSRADELRAAAPKQSGSPAMELHAKRVADASAPAEGTQRTNEQAQKSMAQSPKSKAGMDSAVRTQAPAARMESFSVAPPRQTITFTWDGQTFELEADSVRVVEDELGRTLHIYTREGIIRIRLAE